MLAIVTNIPGFVEFGKGHYEGNYLECAAATELKAGEMVEGQGRKCEKIW